MFDAGIQPAASGLIGAVPLGGIGASFRRPAEDAATEQASADAIQASERSVSGEALTDDEQREVERLQARDREVRQHEQAHVAAAGSLYRGGPSYEYQRGPDGRQYAVGGSVQIDTSPVPNDPEATIAKAQQIRRAALAPAEPSGADRSVAAKANRMEAEARQELAEETTRGEPDTPERASETPQPRIDIYA